MLALRLGVILGLAFRATAINAPAYDATLDARRMSSDPSAPIVELGYAQYQGALNNSTNVTSFLGVRFAAAPTGATPPLIFVPEGMIPVFAGDLRWRAPVSPETVTGVQSATEKPNDCLAADYGMAATNPYGNVKRDVEQSEDCLFLR